MKRGSIFFLVLFILSFISSIIHANNATSKTIFVVQPIFRPTSPEMISIRRERLRMTDEEKRYSFDVIPFGGKTMNEEDLAEYFLPFGKNEILSGELGSTAVKQNTVDAIANYFGILTSDLYKAGFPVDGTLNNYTFESRLSFHPKQVFGGVTLCYKQHLSRHTDKGFWFDVVIPIEHITNDMGLKEEIIKKGGPDGDDPNVPQGFVGSMTQAFKQSAWKYGKINGKMDTIRIADLYFRLGYITVKEETHYLNSYLGFSIGSGNPVTSEFVFEPIVGQNQHNTFFSGISAGFRIWSSCEQSLYYELDTCGTLFFNNEQTRSFDLKDKSWSRYMWVYLDKNSTTTSPGINVFTKRVTVDAGTSRDFNSALVYKNRCFYGELGYHFYSRQAEEVQLVNPWQEGPAIASIIKNGDFIAGGASRNNATINEYLDIGNDTINGVETYVEIKESDLNLESAAHPALISHNVYFSLAYHWDCSINPKYAGLGASYEFATNNAVTKRVMLWGRFGISF